MSSFDATGKFDAAGKLFKTSILVPILVSYPFLDRLFFS